MDKVFLDTFSSQLANTTFFRVPNPSKDYGYDVCKVWIESLGNPQFKNMDLSVIYGKRLLVCARHFKHGDFLSPNKLKESVVPTLHLPKRPSLVKTINIYPVSGAKENIFFAVRE